MNCMLEPPRNKVQYLCLIILCVFVILYFALLEKWDYIALSNISFRTYREEWQNSEDIVRSILKLPDTSQNKKKTYTILYWTSSYYNGQNWFGQGKTPFAQCDYSNCFATSNRDLYNESDAILMILYLIDGYPKYRFPHQKWILHNLEAPPKACKNGCKQFNGIFNATSSYDTRSEIVTNYSVGFEESKDRGIFVKRSMINKHITMKNYATGKTKLVAWFVGSIEAQSKRRAYAQKLEQYIQVDIYGAAAAFTSKLKCPHSSHNRCMDKLRSEYKFYLSFENSLCSDYVTEKLWTAINSDVVPVVLGAFNYSNFLPPKSYIDIKDFDSPKDLAEYLVSLDRNDTLYNQYLAWKEKYEIKQHAPIQCGFCEYLNRFYDIRRVYDRVDLFWDERTQCQKPEEFYSNMDKTVWEHFGENMERNLLTIL